jgi:signal transduction histidine kinase
MNLGIGKLALTGFVLTIAVLVLSGGLSQRNLKRLARNEALVVHTHEVLDQLRETLKALSEAESGQRSYIISGEPSYLDLYHVGFDAVRAHIEQLKSLTSDNPVQQERLARLDPLIRDRLASLQSGVAARDAEGLEGGRRYVLAGKGREQMQNIRQLVSEMETMENALLKERERESRVSYQTSVITQWITTLLGLGLVLAGFLLAARELATRRAGAEALARANDELEIKVEARTVDLGLANESLRRSNLELEQFASVASHDLQEPLRKIQAFGDRLQTKCAAELGESGRDYVTRMLGSAGRMRSLIDALLTFSRVTTKAQPFVPVNLATTAAEVISDLEEQVRRTGGRIELVSLPTIEADPLQMRQLLQNLIGNALKFAQPGKPPVVRLESRLLEIGSGEIGLRWEISVRDNGIGFEEIYLDRIFELFQRLHGRHEYEGTGIGLAICRKIVERHNGTITAVSVPGAGTTFLVALPARQQ